MGIYGLHGVGWGHVYVYVCIYVRIHICIAFLSFSPMVMVLDTGQRS